MARYRFGSSFQRQPLAALVLASASLLGGCSFFDARSSQAGSAANQPGSAANQPGSAANQPGSAANQQGTVEWVVDGDTVDLIIDGQEERVRLIGIDAPESVSRNDPVQCFGPEASAALSALLPVGTTVLISRDSEARDRYGRLLLYLTRQSDGLFINQHLIEAGYADVLFFEPNTSFEVDFTAARNISRSDSIGLWGSCDGPDQPIG